MRRWASTIVGLLAWVALVPGLDAATVPPDSSVVDEDLATAESAGIEGVVPADDETPSAEGAAASLPLPPEIQQILAHVADRRAAFFERVGVKSSKRSVSTLVVGGEQIDISEAPWQVFLSAGLQYFEDDPSSFVYAFFCGGSIIDAEWIVTAAHCVENPSVLEYLHVASGVSSNVGLAKEDFSQVEAIFVHPEWDSWFFDNDIALLKLSSPIDLDGVADMIDLPVDVDDAWPAKGTPATITGWGANEIVDGYYQYPEDLHKGEVFVLAGPGSSRCGLYEPFGAYVNPDTMLCAGLPQGGRDTCFGDSGGPLAIDVGGANVLAGITSWGTLECGAVGFPGIFTRVTTYVSWLEGIVRAPQGTPVITSLSPGNRSLLVEVNTDGISGAPLTNFEYTFDNRRWTALAPPDADGEFRISGLRNGRTYTVRVRAVNPFGKSEPSDPVTGTPSAILPASATIDSIAPGRRSLGVHFTQPETPGGSKIVSYEYSIDGGKTWKAYRSTKSPLVIKGLKSGREYSVIIRARTADGPGAPSAPRSATPAS